MNKKNHIRLLTAVSFLVMFAFPLYAQEKEDSVITFRFLSGKDMFFSPGMSNGEELARLFDFVGRNKEMITSRKLPLYVDGYCISKSNESENLAIARIRSNRVKSELITRKGLTEDCFITRNHAEKGDFVTVRINIPKDEIEHITISESYEEPEFTSVTEPAAECETIVAETFDQPEFEGPSSQQAVADDETSIADIKKVYNRVALKTNLLDYAILMPNLQIEWMFANRWSAALEAQGAWYAKESPHKVYRLATVMPEVRFWALERSRWHGMYVGIFGGAGLYDLDKGKTDHNGHEGEGAMVGVSAGYMWPISKHLSLDAGIGVGYMKIRDKEYAPADGHFLYQFTKNINYFGPLRLKLSLVWRIPK